MGSEVIRKGSKKQGKRKSAGYHQDLNSYTRIKGDF